MAPIDEFVLTLNGVPRLKHKLDLVIYLGSSSETIDSVTPVGTVLDSETDLDQQTDTIIAASNSVLNSSRLKKLMEVILVSFTDTRWSSDVQQAFGNLMNSQRRGGAYGFKLSAFDQVFPSLFIASSKRRDSFLRCTLPPPSSLP